MPGKLLQLTREAGVEDARERLLRFAIDVPLSFEGFWELRTEMSDNRSSLAFRGISWTRSVSS